MSDNQEEGPYEGSLLQQMTKVQCPNAGRFHHPESSCAWCEDKQSIAALERELKDYRALDDKAKESGLSGAIMGLFEDRDRLEGELETARDALWEDTKMKEVQQENERLEEMWNETRKIAKSLSESNGKLQRENEKLKGELGMTEDSNVYWKLRERYDIRTAEVERLREALEKMKAAGDKRFKNWRIHKNDSPDLGQHMWHEVKREALAADREQSGGEMKITGTCTHGVIVCGKCPSYQAVKKLVLRYHPKTERCHFDRCMCGMTSCSILRALDMMEVHDGGWLGEPEEQTAADRDEVWTQEEIDAGKRRSKKLADDWAGRPGEER